MTPRVRPVPLITVAAVGLITWWLVREPTRASYLANVLRQVHHLPGRYAT
jgi:hypothetical protein